MKSINLLHAPHKVGVIEHWALVMPAEGASGGGSESKPQQELGAQQDEQLQGGMSPPDSPHPGPQGGGVKQQKQQVPSLALITPLPPTTLGGVN